MNGSIGRVEAAEFLRDRYGRRARGVSPAGRGEWSVAYAFRCDKAEYVVRFGGEREDFEKDRLAGAYASRELPIPRVVEVGETLGGFYAVSERAFGAHLETLDEPAMRAVLPSLFSALDAARRADVSHTVGYGLWDAAGAAPHPTWQGALLAVGDDSPTGRTHGWRERLASSPLGCGPFDEALDCLHGLVGDCPGERHLTHNDLLNRNVFVADGRIAAVIDWGCAMYADFVYELAQLTFWAPWFPGLRGIDLAGEAERHYETVGLHVPGFRERLRAYEIHIGLVGAAYNAFRGRWDELEATTRRMRTAVEAQAGAPT